ncbi:hypothetical protein [Catellatospora sichuanensis]|uniref:hypothetical protein n=1 Tax=Catellatospora sichuanensis TaxID=1969805 RepID=UPI0011828F41|nr:hypothetical protein [Catellatospora sichuanensis]
MDNGEQRDALRRALGWLAHPVSLAGLLLLLVNDHLLKEWQPGLITGKLSDIAGMLMFPPLLAVLGALVAPRMPVRGLAVAALAVTGAGFAFVKSTAYGAALAAQAWSAVNGSSVVRADRTDLLALPALVLCWWAWRRSLRRPAPGRGVARLVRGAVLVPVALLATVATSPPNWPEMTGVAEAGGQAVLMVEDRNGQQYAFSPDDGLTWGPVEHWPDLATTSRNCAGDTCYRAVAGRLLVESSQDGGATWRTEWEISGKQLAVLTDEYEDSGVFGMLGTPAGDLSSRMLVVLERDGGHVVLVANGRDGLLRRDVDGRWTRLGMWWHGVWTPAPPLAEVWRPTPSDRALSAGFTVVGVLLLVLIAGAIAAAAGRRVSTTLQLVLAGLIAAATTITCSVAAAAAGISPGAGPALSALLCGGLAAVALGVLTARLRRARQLSGRRVAAVLAVGAVGALMAELSRAAILGDGIVLGRDGLTQYWAGLVVCLVALVAAGLGVAAGRARLPRGEPYLP